MYIQSQIDMIVRREKQRLEKEKQFVSRMNEEGISKITQQVLLEIYKGGMIR